MIDIGTNIHRNSTVIQEFPLLLTIDIIASCQTFYELARRCHQFAAVLSFGFNCVA